VCVCFFFEQLVFLLAEVRLHTFRPPKTTKSEPTVEEFSCCFSLNICSLSQSTKSAMTNSKFKEDIYITAGGITLHDARSKRNAEEQISLL